MASCARCGAALIATARFCAACGSPVPRGPVTQQSATNDKASPAPAPVTGVPPSIPDPFAKTVMGDAAAVAAAATGGPLQPTQPMAPPVSPLASSVMEKPGQAPKVRVIATPWNATPPSGPGPFAQQPAPQGAFGPGALVLVQWADGNRYPGTVLRAAGTQILVAFPDGQQHWVDARYVSAGT